jgi:hypothetical protein
MAEAPLEDVRDRIAESRKHIDPVVATGMVMATPPGRLLARRA